MRLFTYTIAVLASLLLPVEQAHACDLCSLFNASRMQEPSAGQFTLAASEQFTSYDQADAIQDITLRDGEIVRSFSTTQLSLAYDLTEQFSAQITLPLLYRNFDSVARYRSDTDSDFDIGDVTLAGSYLVLNEIGETWSLLGSVYGGIKLPTGDSGSLDDLNSVSAEIANLKHHPIGSTSGGRALVFGSGSTDYILGGSFFALYDRFFLLSSAQYSLRTEGDFQYEFADDFLWSTGPAYYLLLDHDYSVALRLALSGEHKASDRHQGERVSGSHVSNLYLGPELLISLNEKIGIECGIDVRVTEEDNEATIIPVWRGRFAVSYRI